MKRQILTIIITVAISIALFGGSRAPEPIRPAAAEAQSANPRGDLVTKVRQDVAAIRAGFDSFTLHRNEYVEANVNFVIGDLSGSNITSPATFVADDVDQVFVDLNDIITKVKAGGTISAGEWTNVMKIR
jgi:Zn-dependent M28 family amino/carboxypeptidase